MQRFATRAAKPPAPARWESGDRMSLAGVLAYPLNIGPRSAGLYRTTVELIRNLRESSYRTRWTRDIGHDDRFTRGCPGVFPGSSPPQGWRVGWQELDYLRIRDRRSPERHGLVWRTAVALRRVQCRVKMMAALARRLGGLHLLRPESEIDCNVQSKPAKASVRSNPRWRSRCPRS